MGSDRAHPTVPRLSEQSIAPGERWIYSAGFNVEPDLRSTGRIDCELADLDRLATAGARIAILAHQGSHRDATAGSLEFAARYLSRRLGRPVDYVAENDTGAAAARSHSLAPGGIVLFGNARVHAGEERNDPELARRYARLGDRIAVGGFSKAHRAHASNVGLIDLLPAVAADNLLDEIDALTPWTGTRDDLLSVAVLGGTKPEKTVHGLEILTRSYDLVIPGGVVLNTLLRVRGCAIGASELGPAPDRCARVAAAVLSRRNRAAIHLPEYVLAADPRAPGGPPVPLPVDDGVPRELAIVDYVVRPSILRRLEAPGRAGRAVVAGTPSRYRDGHGRAAAVILRALGGSRWHTVLMGGDTVADLPWGGAKCTGGGSALEYLVTGTCAVIRAFERNLTRGAGR
ncbi:phosphoglycerate kinase [Nocardia mexicana]|uniref:Phosphoglycerate kinase n=1 Tax=Nocardia mexicana TaxID=279262 RepID=A0A370HEX2_9NOCA|nr:phosphoglycerate kinase [Nocardia mexicana]RDI55585.1 phosphoglycerate kinase [Nocardia mexicana]